MSSPHEVVPSRQRAAVLFADVHGYARLMSQAEKQTCERVTRSIRLIRSLIGDYGGCVVQTAGEGVLALFANPAEAFRFALAIQQEFRNEPVWHPNAKPISFRIGINMGEVIFGEDGAHGHSVDVAARIKELAQPGGICISEAVRQAVQATPGVQIRSLGLQILEDSTEPLEVFAIEVPGPQPAYHTEPFLSDEWRSEASAVPEASIVVLPLDNMSGAPGNVHLCDGITRDIITNLSRFRDLLVIAPHSAFLCKQLGLPPRETRRRLGVRYLFTGGLERRDSRVRIRAQLTEIEVERVIWSERFDGHLGDLFSFQDEVTAVIAARLAIQVSAAERRRKLAGQMLDLRAYGLILRGQHLSIQFKKEANLHARRLFENAVEVDPACGRSYAGLSRTFNIAWRYGWTQSRELCLNKAIELAREATKRDELDARGYSELGCAYLYSKRHDDSLFAYGRAIELNPNDADILAEMANAMSFAGDSTAALDLLKRAVRLNPYHPDWYLWFLGEAFFDLGQYEEAIRALQRMNDQSEGHRLLAASYALSDRLEEAKYHAQQVMSVYPDFTIEHWRTVPPDRNPEPLERFLEGLRKAGLK